MEYLIHLAILFSIYAILGVSLNLVVGYTGLLSVTHAAFFGVGAYTTAIFLTKSDIGFFSSLIFGIVIAVVVSSLIGVVLSKFKGDYYALGTFGFNTIVFAIFLNWQNLTMGPLGISGIPKPELFGINFANNFNFLVLSFIFLFLVYFFSRFVVNSSFGRVLKAIREDEIAISVFGYNTLYFKLIIFVISSAMAAVAGSLFASYITFIDPSSFQLQESMFILVIIILGGLANLRGSLLGALFLILLPEILRFVGFPSGIEAQMRQVVYGIILILLMLYRPQGVIGEYKL
ncbi:MAG: branched-chain amino acid ABC transporter permease [Candidatus Magasanikbacteria bacterium]|uniref:Branched-chain amino acid ABC transporter permease n=1 Tax=Candidatus Magasanikbacteria bacterium CG10_big_fil_rev_8_21_14_0_10_38_6 TaxID=1974647 RepID=A0A2M6P025_9BACT|nr:branched-chain amino acid ABC transporter permease [Candidatus Magasanikbacteria bacterium]NCS71773.1 branched-chain amino acid ABC transporter permease [Candidatus Magasanikbacteria bacterium]PIR77057.1 MAG: branched-chain amino acid ABC transporter permease [Candidatus Magasanikbacteria bacterium CG10_big_fil_rev_8_21_14_0_10_38_6]